jgi:hypothetical protein
MKKLIIVGFICFVLGICLGYFFSPNRYKIYSETLGSGSVGTRYYIFKMDTLTGTVWRLDPEKSEFKVCPTNR